VSNTAILNVDEHEVSDAVRHFKEWLIIANRTFPNVLAQKAAKRDEEERVRIRREIETEERRLKVLSEARRAM
jgi:ribose 1,5-bisphosphokinase PhnN